jgi:hypothetical protein
MVMIVLSAMVGLLVTENPTPDSSDKIVRAPTALTAVKEDSTIELRHPRFVPLNNYGFSANELVWMNAERRDKQLEAMKAVGISWVRIDMQWYVVQPSNAYTFDWSVYDRTVEAISSHGLRTLPILDYAPAWAALSGCRPSPSHKCAPADPKAFANYAAAAVNRYTPLGVTSWEIWNEPNSPRFWYPRVDAADYAALLKETYPAIKKVNPDATVITGGLRSANIPGDVAPHDYVAEFYDAGAGPYFDALGAHPYTYPDLPTDTSTATNGWSQMLEMRKIAVAHGDESKKIWMTEVGATTGGPHPVSESRQQQIVHEAIRIRSSYPWAGPLFWYDYQDLGSRSWVSEHFFGLVRADGSKKPAYQGFVEAIRRYQ